MIYKKHFKPLFIALILILLPTVQAFNLSDTFDTDTLSNYDSSGAEWKASQNVTSFSGNAPFNSSYLFYQAENYTTRTNVSVEFSYIDFFGSDTFIGAVIEGESVNIVGNQRASGMGCAIRNVGGTATINTVNYIISLLQNTGVIPNPEAKRFRVVMQHDDIQNRLLCKIWEANATEPISWTLNTSINDGTQFVNWGERFGFSSDGGVYSNLHFLGYNTTPNFPEVLPCVEDWICTGYDTPVCLINDTSTAQCNQVLDANLCGTNYTGDYTEFANQTGVCDFCTPDFALECPVWNTSVCSNNISANYTCASTTDNNNCFAQTGLVSDEPDLLALYGERACVDLTNEGFSNLQFLLIALLPLILITGFIISQPAIMQRLRDNSLITPNRALSIVIGVIAVISLIALL